MRFQRPLEIAMKINMIRTLAVLSLAVASVAAYASPLGSVIGR